MRRGRDPLPLRVPLLDGSTWPTPREVGRRSFASSALYRMGYGEAFTLEAHDVAEPLLEQVLPRLQVGASPQDEPYLRRMFASAAQIGAGIGIVERRMARHDTTGTDPQIAGALLEAADDLPLMARHQREVAVYLLQCGHYLARTGMDRLPTLLDGLGDRR